MKDNELDIDFGPAVELSKYYAPSNIVAKTPTELKFKLAACKLVFSGIYPSGRQILIELGRSSSRTSGKANLNGPECRWKADIFRIFGIKPYFGYSTRFYRKDWDETLSKYKFEYERGPKGTLIPIK